MSNDKMVKKGFYFDQKSCVGCRTCQIACKDKNDLGIGLFFRHVFSYETGDYPLVKTFHYAATCNHCDDPACVAVCPNQATYIDEEDGTVQHDDEKCIGCEYCVKACPYGHPQYMKELGVVHKCDACIGLRSVGEKPACVASCPMRALDFGPIDELRAMHPDAVDKITILPDPSQTNPSVAIDAKLVALEGESVEMLL